jgi:ribonucleoside-diphosphate reductase alpha chain
MDAFATSISLALQYGVPLSALVQKFSHMRFEPSGMTPNRQIPMAKSILDYIFRWLASKFLNPEEQKAMGVLNVDMPKEKTDTTQATGKQKVGSSMERPVESADSSSVATNAAAEGPVKTTSSKNGANGYGHAPQLNQALTFFLSDDAPPCAACGSSMMVRQGACYRCLNCGTQGGCG